MLDDLVGEQRQADGVSLLHRQMSQTGCQQDGVAQLRLPRIAHRHRTTDVDDQVQIDVCLGVVLFDVQPVLSAIDLPIEVSEVVSGEVFAMRRKIDRKSHVWAAMQTMQKSLDDPARNDFEIFDRCQ